MTAFDLGNWLFIVVLTLDLAVRTHKWLSTPTDATFAKLRHLTDYNAFLENEVIALQKRLETVENLASDAIATLNVREIQRNVEGGCR